MLWCAAWVGVCAITVGVMLVGLLQPAEALRGEPPTVRSGDPRLRAQVHLVRLLN